MVPLQSSNLSVLLIIDSIILLLLHRLLSHLQLQLQLHQVIPPSVLLLELYCCFLPLQFYLLKLFPLRRLLILFNVFQACSKHKKGTRLKNKANYFHNILFCMPIYEYPCDLKMLIPCYRIRFTKCTYISN